MYTFTAYHHLNVKYFWTHKSNLKGCTTSGRWKERFSAFVFFFQAKPDIHIKFGFITLPFIGLYNTRVFKRKGKVITNIQKIKPPVFGCITQEYNKIEKKI